METLNLIGTISLPTVNFNPTGELKITGRSIPEHPVKFYEPISNWITDFVLTNPPVINILIHLDYLNTHSTECVLIMLKKLENYAKDSGSKVNITWNFDEDDEDMEALGEDLDSLVDIPFTIKEIKD
ncbi:MAG: DUF1987 domain-containing protein [Vicingaceae bacterium]|nr:DUF1987 domain-containing protein [Vicingaceae bacterium]